MKIVKGNGGSDILFAEMKRSKGALLVFNDFCNQYKKGEFQQPTLDCMFKLLNPMLEDPLNSLEMTKSKDIGKLAKKYLKGSRQPNRPKNSAEHSKKGMSITLKFLKLRDELIPSEDAYQMAGEAEGLGIDSARKYVRKYMKDAKAHREHFLNNKG